MTPMLRFTSVKSTPDSFERYFDAHWLPLGDYFSHHRSRFLQSWSFLNDALPAQPGSVLDVGGIGPIASYLASNGWAAHESKSDLRGPLAFADSSFDLVICTETIEHIKDIESDQLSDLEAFNFSGVKNMLCELARTLRQSGALLVTTPNASSLLTLSKWLHGHTLLMDPDHVREFTPRELQCIVTSCGFTLRKMLVVNSWIADPSLSEPIVAKLLALSPTFRAVERGDNIFAYFNKQTA